MSDICWAVKMCADEARWLVISKDRVCRWSKHWAARSLADTREEATTALRDLRKSGMPYLRLVKVTRCGHKLPKKSLLSLERETGRILALKEAVAKCREVEEDGASLSWTEAAAYCADIIEGLLPNGDGTKEGA